MKSAVTRKASISATVVTRSISPYYHKMAHNGSKAETVTWQLTESGGRW
jgi:hypothetical protein